MTIPNDLRIAGVGFRVGGPPTPHRDMLYEAVRESLEDAGLTRDQIDTAVTVASDFAEGRSLANQFILDSIGGAMRPFDLRLGNESLFGLGAGAIQLLAGSHRTVVVAGVWRGSDLAEPKAEIGKLHAARLNVFFERPVVARLNGGALVALADLLQHEGGEVPVAEVPSLSDAAVAVVLKRGGAPSGTRLRGIGWRTMVGWTLADYKGSVRAAAEVAYQRAGGDVRPAWLEVPRFPSAVTGASLSALRPAGDTVVNGLGDERRGVNVMMDGLLGVALATRALRAAVPGTAAVVQSWQGLGSAGTAVAVLESEEAET